MEKLHDLGELVEKTKEKLMYFNPMTEVYLSQEFKDAYADYIAITGNSIEYTMRTAIVTNSSGQKIYLPNQWFVLATYPVELVKEIVKYRTCTETILSENNAVFMDLVSKPSEYKKEIYKSLEQQSNADIFALFENMTHVYLQNNTDNSDVIMHNQEMIKKFVTNKDWWLGGKGIERPSDFYVSSVLGVLNLVNASQSYVATITYAYVMDNNLFNSLQHMCVTNDRDDNCIDIIDDVKKDYTVDELGHILQQMYNTAEKNMKVASIHMFGMKYAQAIIDGDIRINEIIDAAGINESYSAEINKGLNIYRCLKNNIYGISLCEKNRNSEIILRKIRYKTCFDSGKQYNRIIFGAPGTGKSHTLEGDRKELLYGVREVDEKELDLSQYGSYERVTFHPDYSYANFVGTYKPVPKGDEIAYEYVPGPFMRILVKALESAMTDTPKPYVLLIEEINRANTAAVFGDVFQLLDRKDGISEYPIQTSQDMRKYLAKELMVSEDECKEIRIPNNMFIWATMNSADQGVYPMDTAFKRRWDFTYIGIDDGEENIPDRVFIYDNKAVKWNDIRKTVNNVLEIEYGLNEDKLLGPFFISRNVLENADDELFWRTFDNKVLMYLCDDALRHRNGEHLFEDMKTEKLSYAKVHRMFQEKGLGIFNKKILEESNVQTVTDSFVENTNEA